MWSWSEVPFNNWLHREKKKEKNPFFFFFYLTWQNIRCKKLITKLIFHQIPLLPGRRENIHLMPNYVWDLCNLMWRRVADWQVWDNCVCSKHCWHCLPTWPPAAMTKLPGHTHINSSSSSPRCQRKQGVGLILCNTFSPLCNPTQPLILACSIKI